MRKLNEKISLLYSKINIKLFKELNVLYEFYMSFTIILDFINSLIIIPFIGVAKIAGAPHNEGKIICYYGKNMGKFEKTKKRI